MPFFTVYLFGIGWSVWPRSVKGNFSWKNSSKLNKVINEETAFKLVTAWEESYDVITRQLSIRQYTFMKKSVAIKLENSKELNIFYHFKLWKCIYWKHSLKNYSKNKWFSCMFSFLTKVNLHNYLGENYSVETNLWANYYYSEFQYLALNNWYSEKGVKWGKDVVSKLWWIKKIFYNPCGRKPSDFRTLSIVKLPSKKLFW